MADAILGVLFENLNSLIQREFGLVGGVQTEIKKLQSTLSSIQSVLEDAEMKQIRSKAVRDWLSKLKDAAYDADDILNEWSTDHDEFLLQPESDVSSKTCTNQVRDALLSCFHSKRVLFRRKIAKKIKEVRARFDAIAEEKSAFHLVEGVVTTPYSNENRERETSSVLMEPQIYGRENDKENIVKLLLENENDVFVYPILGIGGVGKTTLAQFVYNDERVVKHFDKRIWVCVSDDFDVKRLTKEIVESSSGNPCGFGNLDTIQNLLRQIQTGKKFLLVLDDVWYEKQDKWNVLRNSLSCGAKGSTIIVTTRLPTVATITGTSSPYKLDILSDDDCLSLFKQYAFGTGNEEKPNLVSIGQAIVKKCGGVPLAAKALGSLLRKTGDEKQWELIRDSEIWHLEDGEETTILPALRLSYNNLSPKFRQCFVYCSLFPKDYKMRKEMLVHLWMANGLLQSEGRMEPEDVGEAIFSELLWHSFFQDIEEDDYGNITTFKIHDLLHDLASSVMKSEYSCVKVIDGANLNKNPQKVRHLSITSQSSLSPPLNTTHLSHLLHPHLRTLLLFSVPGEMMNQHVIPGLKCLRVLHASDTQNLPPPSFGKLKHLKYLSLHRCHLSSKWPVESFSGLRNLQVIDLSDNDLESLPASIGDLEHLRHLDLSDNSRMPSLPESICRLKNLQTLKLNSCTELEALPENTSSLCNLRHLENRSCWSLTGMPIGIGRLTCLQTLSCFVVSGDRGCDGGLKELEGLNLLRGELAIRELQNVSNLSIDGEGVHDLLSSKQNLSDLHLSWESSSDDIMESSKQVLKALKPSPKIKTLEIEGYPGSSFPTWMQMGDPLSSFPKLEEIELRYLSHLVDWSLNWKENESLPALQSLSISECPLLLSLPQGLHKLTSLQSLEISDCEELKTLPEELGNLTALKSLTIRGCKSLLSLPQALHKLTSLRALRISDCEVLKTLPEELGNLTALKSLTITGCKSPLSLPEELGNLTALKSLTIRGCKSLLSLPQGLHKLTSLQSLEIYDCEELKTLPEEFGNLTALKSLTIIKCKSLLSLPQGLHKLTSLQALRISDCEVLKTLPEELGNLTALKSLTITGCKSLLSLPQGLHKLTSLQNLYISDCKELKTLPEELGNLTALKSLTIRGCKSLLSLPQGLHKLTSLESLEISHCDNLKSLPKMGIQGQKSSLKELKISYCQNLTSSAFEGWRFLTSLEHLCIDECPLFAVPREDLEQLPALRYRIITGIMPT